MSIKLATSLEKTTADYKFVYDIVPDIAARDAIPDGLRYPGFETIVLDDGSGDVKKFMLVGGITDGDWVESTGGGSGSGVVAVADDTARNAIDPSDRSEGMLVYVQSSVGSVPRTYQLQGGITNSDWVLFAGTPKIVIATSLTTGNTLPIETGNTAPLDQRFIIASSAGAIFLSSTPFGTTPPRSGTRITVIGSSDANTVLIAENDNTNGVIGYDKTYVRGDVGVYEYNSTLTRYVIVSTNR